MALDFADVRFFKQAVGAENIGRETDTDITAKCPVCGDSRTSRNKKRLHLYKKGEVTNVNCFNGDCSVVNKTMYSFLRDFYPELLPQYKRETFNFTIDKLKDESRLKNLVKKKETEKKLKPVQTLDLTPYMQKLSDSDDGMIYLRNRGISYKPDSRGIWYFGIQDLQIGETLYKITNNIVIPLYYEKEMYGFYSRSVNSKNFITYMADSNIGYKIWNWFNINLNEPVYIFEGIFDAISSGKKNIIALLGAKLPEDRLKEIKYPVFVLDNDRTGILNMIDYANRGYSCFIQPHEYKSYKDMNELMLNNKELNISEIIDNNTSKGLSAVMRLKQKL